MPAATAPNERWSMDFVTDRLFDGRRFRMLTLVDHFSRVSPAIEVDVSLTGQRVVAVLDRLAQVQQVPMEICVDNGPEFISRALDEWAHRNGVKLTFSRPAAPVVVGGRRPADPSGARSGARRPHRRGSGAGLGTGAPGVPGEARLHGPPGGLRSPFGAGAAPPV